MGKKYFKLVEPFFLFWLVEVAKILVHRVMFVFIAGKYFQKLQLLGIFELVLNLLGKTVDGL